MLKNISDLKNIFKESQKIKEKVKEIENDIAKKTLDVETGGGIVKITINGRQEIQSLKIDKELFSELANSDLSMLQDLIIACVNEALHRSKKMLSDELKKMTGGFNIPGISDLLNDNQ